MGPERIAKDRERALEHYRDRAQKLQTKEDDLKERMDPESRNILNGKRILLLQEMLHDAGYVYERVAGDIAAGFPLVGDLGLSGAFEARERPAGETVDQLMAGASWAQQAAAALTRASGDDDLDKE
eukprot:13652575-Heterocapsa_arctica.AAC.1